jgi:hypothetical protein
MRLPADPAKRTALVTVGGLVLALALILMLFHPSEEEARGIGLTRVLQDEQLWRHQLWLEGEHINELDLWQIQETLAVRVGLSTSGLKGLLRRAVNAKDASYRAHGYLLAGNTFKASEIAAQIAQWHQKNAPANPAEQAFWLHRRADALWRGTLEDPVPSLRQALALIEKRDLGHQRRLLSDLASWHWARANFRPEDPRAEMELGLAALNQWLTIAEPSLSQAEQTAALRQRGQFQLRLAALEEPRDPTALQAAVADFEQALNTASRDERPAVWAALQHDLGLAHLDLGQASAAAEHLSLALEVRGVKMSSSARVDVRLIERRLAERLQSEAFLALAQARTGQTEAALERVAEVHGMTLPEDPGHAWFIAQCALVALHQSPTARQKALEHYPLDQAQEPGVPAQASLASP